MLHPALEMKSLKQLPPSIRVIASKAAGKSRTPSDVATARRVMDLHTLSSSQRLAFLPVFFAHLDPEDIPTLGHLDDPNRLPAIREEVLSALGALDAIVALNPPQDVGPSLWPRVWAWFDFMHVHWDLLVGLDISDMPSAKRFYLNIITFIHEFREHSVSRTLMSTPPRFWACLVKGWEFLPEIDDPDMRTTLLHTLAIFLGNRIAHSEPSQFEAMVDAAGSVHHIALLVLHFVRAAIDGPLLEPAMRTTYIQQILLFVTSAADCPLDIIGDPSAPLGPLIISLCALNLPGELVSAILLLCDQWEQDQYVPIIIENCLTLVEHMVQRLSTNLWLHVLIDRGLLQALALITLKCGAATEGRRAKLDHQVRMYLHQIPPAGLAFYYPVHSFEESYVAMHDIIEQDDFEQSPLLEDWHNFCILAEDRIGPLDEYLSEDFVVFKACDNSKCGVIEDANDMAGRCSGCQAFYYCSRECQNADWRAGHRKYCSSHGNLLLTQRSTNPKLSFSERSFMRTLTVHTYFSEQQSICAQQVKILAAHPASSPPLLFTLFDFCKLPVVVTVEAVGELDKSPEVPECIADMVGPSSDEWVDLALRAERARGRADLHAVRVMNGQSPHVWIIPLRSDSADIYEAVRSLADRVRKGEVEGEKEILDVVDGILREHQDAVEIH